MTWLPRLEGTRLVVVFAPSSTLSHQFIPYILRVTIERIGMVETDHDSVILGRCFMHNIPRLSHMAF